jgi:hypothetical protein
MYCLSMSWDPIYSHIVLYKLMPVSIINFNILIIYVQYLLNLPQTTQLQPTLITKYSFSVHVCYLHYLLPTHAQLIKTLHTSHLKLHFKMSMPRSKSFNKTLHVSVSILTIIRG